MKRIALAISIIVGLVVCTSPAIFSESQAKPGATPHGVIPTAGPVFPFESSLMFVLDTAVTSRTAVIGNQLRAHLRDALVVNGVQLAPAGAPTTIRVTGVSRAQMGDVDGAIDLFFDHLDLGRYGSLPIRAASVRITIVRTAGRRSTSGVTDTAGDIFIPGYQIYHALRKGEDVTLPRGTLIRARTTASIDATNPQHVVIVEPPALKLSVDQPYSAFTPIPFHTVPASPTPRPKPTPRLKPTATPAPGTPAPVPSST